jgi:hypothetical protein
MLPRGYGPTIAHHMLRPRPHHVRLDPEYDVPIRAQRERVAAAAAGARSAGTILFTGATASVRGAPGYAAFAGAKAALRALAQVPPMPPFLDPSKISLAAVDCVPSAVLIS